MAKALEKLTGEALRLPAKSRAKLADRIWESLEPAAEYDVEKSWNEEIERRLRLDKQGKTKYFPAAKVLADLRKKIR